MNLEKIEITEQTLKIFNAKLNEYAINERPFEKGFISKTHILDILYFLGTSIDEDRFLGSNGFEEFQGILKEAIA